MDAIHANNEMDDDILRTSPRPLGVAAWHGALAPESLGALQADAVQLKGDLASRDHDEFVHRRPGAE